MSSGKTRVLFVCIHNSARSQMAEAFLKQLGGDRFQVESAGVEPGTLNPLAVEAMRLAGIDIGQKTTRSVFDLYRAGRMFDYVIGVCDEATTQRCPVFPGVVIRLKWSFADPSEFTGSHEDRLGKTIAVRDEIRERVRRWLQEEAPPPNVIAFHRAERSK